VQTLGLAYNKNFTVPGINTPRVNLKYYRVFINNARQLNVNNIALVQYKPVKVPTLHFITLTVCLHTRCLHLTLAQGHNV